MTRQFKVKYVAIIMYSDASTKESDMFGDYLLCVSAAKNEMKRTINCDIYPLYFIIQKRYVME